MFVEVGRQQMAERMGAASRRIDASALAQFEHKLLSDLADLAAIPLHARFASFRSVRRLMNAFGPSRAGEATAEATDGESEAADASRTLYDQFVEEHLSRQFLSFFEEYSGLARLMAGMVLRWVEMHATFVTRLDADWPALV